MTNYPKVKAHLGNLKHNLNTVKTICDQKNTHVMWVVKACTAIPQVAKVYEEAGAQMLASSRMSQIITMREAGINVPMALIRIPMISEAPEVIANCQLSLNSEMEVIRALDLEAKKQNKVHKVILMTDLGDLREGFWDRDELVSAAVEIENNLENIHLAGIGTNLGCYGSIVVTKDKMDQLAEYAQAVEEAIGRSLEYVSGGGTTAIPRLVKGDMPEKVNLLRIGEAVLVGRDLLDIYDIDLGNISTQVFTMEMEVIEIKDKPTYPVGEIMSDGFGLEQQYEDRGIRKRALLGAGKLDYAFPEMLIPLEPGMEMVGASSDHTIVDIEDCQRQLKVGDIVEFEMSYANLAYATHSRDVSIEIVE